MNKQLTLLLSLILLLVSSVNCYADKISGSKKIVRLSLEKYSLPVFRSFDASKLKSFGFNTPEKATSSITPMEKDKNINGYLVSVTGFDQKEKTPNMMLGMVFLKGSMKMQLPSFAIDQLPSLGIDQSEFEAELPTMPEIILMRFGKSLVSDGWKLLTFDGFIEDPSDESSSKLPPKLKAYIKSKFPSLEFSSFYFNAIR
jgi:hypothetical protein